MPLLLVAMPLLLVAMPLLLVAMSLLLVAIPVLLVGKCSLPDSLVIQSEHGDENISAATILPAARSGNAS